MGTQKMSGPANSSGHSTTGSEKALQQDAGPILSASDVTGIKVRGQLIPALATGVHMG